MPSVSQTAPAAWYALRRTMPPWSFADNLRELRDCLPRYRVDELIVKVDTEEFSHGQPQLDWLRAYQPNLFQVKALLEELGIRYSLNPWITVGHCDRGRDDRQRLPGFQPVVGHDGVACTSCACHLDPVWRENTRQAWTLYAETKPHVLWVEDDIRTFNHAPVRFGCFCPQHLARFAALVGHPVTREELAAALLQPGEPHLWRALFLAMQAEVTIETVAFLARTVHDVSPQTRMGLMSSGARYHCLEGRDWFRFATALADGQPLHSRPPMGNYCEDSLRGLYYSHDSIKLTRHALPPGIVEQTEVESVPFTRYSKSAAFTFIETALSFAYGSHGVTLNLFDHCGTPMESEPVFGKLLGERKEYLNALATEAQKPGRFRGVQLLHHTAASAVKRLPLGADYSELAEDGYADMVLLEAHGIPTTYDAENVVAASGQTVRALDDAALRRLLGAGRGLLLDATAAAVFLERGLGELIGLCASSPVQPLNDFGPLCAEEFHHSDFGGAPRCFLTCTLPFLGRTAQAARLTPLPGAIEISRLVDPDTRPVLPGMIAFANPLGGRVVISAYDLASACGVAMHHTFRQRQLHGVVHWLARNQEPLLVRGDGVYPLALRHDAADGSTLLGLFNLSLDPWRATEFDLPADFADSSLECLTPNGRWEPLPATRCALRNQRRVLAWPEPIPYASPLFLRLPAKK